MTEFFSVMVDPVLCSKVLSRFSNSWCKVGVAEMQGARSTMEDAFKVCMALPNHPDVGFFAVFDGHCGERVSKFLADNLWKRIDSLEDSLIFSTEHLDEIILQMDKEILRSKFHTHGSTAVFALVKFHSSPDVEEAKHQVLVGNIGDSRCLRISQSSKKLNLEIDEIKKSVNENSSVKLGSSDPLHASGIPEKKQYPIKRRKALGLISLTSDHKPILPKERERIVNSGNFVVLQRINGELAVSRAFGDSRFKKNKQISQVEQAVCALPDYKMTSIIIQPQEEQEVDKSSWNGILLLIACDGLFECLSNEQVATKVVRILNRQQATLGSIHPEKAAASLVQWAQQSGSGDNMTAILVLFERLKCSNEESPESEFDPGPLTMIRENNSIFCKSYLNFAKRFGFEELAEKAIQSKTISGNAE